MDSEGCVCFDGGVVAISFDAGPSRAAACARGALALGLSLGLGCGEAGGEARVLELELFKQARHQDVFLNETLVFHFSAELERASVTPVSVRILDPARRPVPGRLLVERSSLLFRPELPRSSALDDGGFASGLSYTVELGGYPRPDALRARDGAPLSRSYASEFRIMDVEPLGSGRVFEDLSAEVPKLQLERELYEPGEGIVITSSEPLHPATLHAEDFELWPYEGVQGEPTRIALVAELERNQSNGARLVLRPRDASGGPLLLEPGEYRLWLEDQSLRLEGLGGLPAVIWDSQTSLRSISVRPADQGPRFLEDFLDPARRSPEAVEGFDGTAWWSDTGAVRVRYPRMAGDGSDGRVLLGGDEPRTQVRATQLTLPAGEVAQLMSDHDFVLLSAQGSLHIEGELSRRVEVGATMRASGESVAAWKARVRSSGEPWRTPGMRAAIEAATTLAGLCEHAREEGPAWTMLVAGGDLVVSGRIEVDGPLLLAAGGWIRVTGEVEAREVWIASEGGGRFQPHPYPAQLAFESPSVNPLREPLHLAVLSAPVRPPRGVERWGRPRVEGRDGAGRFEVRFLGEREVADGTLVRMGPVDDPRLLEGCESVQLWIELSMEPGVAWEPPVVDHVELSWLESAHPGEGR